LIFYFKTADIDDCRIEFCYPGVECIDLKAPLRGYKCGICPSGFIGDGKRCEKQGFLIPAMHMPLPLPVPIDNNILFL
jgi:hypothetical protein